MGNFLPKNPILFGLHVTKPHKKWAIFALLAVLAATTVDRLSVLVLKNLTDAISADQFVLDTVWFWGILFPLFFMIGQILWRASGFTGMVWFTNFRITAYQQLYDYLTLHSKDYFSNRFAGALVNKIANAVDGSEDIFDRFLWRFIPILFGLLWYILIAGMNNVMLGAILGIWSLIFLLINLWFAKKLQPRSFHSAQALSTLKGRIVDSLANISLVHEYAYVGGERTYIRGFLTTYKDAFLRRWRMSELVLVANGVQIVIFMVLMIGTSLYLFQQGVVSIGVVVMVIFMIGDITDTERSVP